MEAVIARLNKEGRTEEALHSNAIFFLCKKHDRAIRAELRIAILEASLAAAERDAGRYRWLRDDSVPPHNFYISVPDEFKDERYTPQQVDAAIDAAITALATKGAGNG